MHENEFEDIDVINSGTYGRVYLKLHKKTNTEYAVKDFRGEIAFNAGNEVDILQKIQHPSIVKFHSVILNNNGLFSYSMEYAPNGNVKEKLTRKSLSPTEKSIIALGTSYAIRELHKRSYVHLDIKPENVLLNKDNYPLLCDFGFTFSLSALKDSLTSYSEFGTYPYTAPELYGRLREKNISLKADIFSFGIFLYNLLTEHQVFSKNFRSEINSEKVYSDFKKNIRPSLEDYLEDNSKIVKLIQDCWETDPDFRPTIDEVVDYLSKIENVFGHTEEKQFNDYISFVENGVKGIREKSEAESAKQQNFDEIAKKSLDLSKKTTDVQKSLSLLAFSMPVESKYQREISIYYNIISFFKKSKPKPEVLVKANDFFMSKSDNLTAQELVEVADNFFESNSPFCWNYYDLAVEKKSNKASLKIQKFLTFTNIDVTFERFIKYAFQNAEYINKHNMLTLDFEQELNCLFIAKYYIQSKMKDLPIPKKNKPKSKSKSRSSKSGIDNNDEIDLELIESKFDFWIEKLVSHDYISERKKFVEASEADKFKNQLSYEFQFHMAEKGCPIQARLLCERLRKDSLNTAKKSKSAQLQKDYIKYLEISVVNGNNDCFKTFAEELKYGRFVEKDDRRAQRLLFFESLIDKKGPFERSELFTYESFYPPDRQKIKQSPSKNKVTQRKTSSSDYGYFSYSDDDDDDDFNSSSSDDDDEGKSKKKRVKSGVCAQRRRVSGSVALPKKKLTNSFKNKNSKKKK